MTETRKRLEEASYFLDRMKETQHSSSASSEQGHFAFRCDLNAFLSFARSVTTLPKPFPNNHKFVMENEFGKKQGFRAWYNAQEQQMQGDTIAIFFAMQRNISIHEKSVQPHGNTMITVIEHLSVSDFGYMVSTPANATEEEYKNLIEQAKPPEPPLVPVKPTEITVEQLWYFDGLPGGMIPQNEVLTVCTDYIAKLEQIVDDCEGLFS